MGFICRKVGLVAIGMAGMKNVILSFSKGLMDGKHAGSKADSRVESTRADLSRVLTHFFISYLFTNELTNN